MKRLLILLALAVSGLAANAQTNVGINNPAPDASAALDVTSTTQGMLVPRMNQAQRNMINMVGGVSTPATGLLIYQTDNTPGFYFYNGTAWTALSGGGTTLPSQAGNAGKYLTTNGTNLSWGSGNVSYELNVTKTAPEAQTTYVGSSLVLPDSVTFSTTNGANAALTGGNTWNGNTFTVGATGAGLYLVDIELLSNIAFGGPMIDMNNTGNSGSSYYGTGTNLTSTGQSPHKSRGQLQKLMYLSAGDNFKIRATSSSTAIGVDLSTDGTTFLRIVKLR